MPSDARIQRFETVLAQRMGHVRCAVEALYHRHNISAVLRTCDSLGVHHVHMVEGHFRPVKGAARGAERWLDLHRHDNAEAAVAKLRDAGVAIWVADIADGAVPPEQVPVDQPVCLWFGAELSGVSPAALAAADGVMSIPMRGFAQSLNVSVAAAMALGTVSARARAQLGDRALLSDDVRTATWDYWMERELALERGIKGVAKWKWAE